LRSGFAVSLSAGMENFASVVEFSLAGFQDDKILRQWIESPAVPIVHTLIDRAPRRRPNASLSRLDGFPRARTKCFRDRGVKHPLGTTQSSA